ncbi:MAG: hypothetical protein M3451_09510, partial [Chloroflexota bacterium]|nr:hypothetical protein [Chloroflexota bacterium]
TAGAVGAAGILATHALPSASAQGTADPFAYPDLSITAVDYAFEMPATVEAGWTHVLMDNQGMKEHHAMFLRPHEGSTIEDVQAALEGGDFGALFATAMSAGGPNVGPGHQASVAMNLEAGQYLVICAIPNEEGIPHFALGMQAVLEVTEGAADSTPPAADATVNLIEMTFEGLPTDTTAGTHVWEVANTGTQLHEIVVLQLTEGVTIDQAIQAFSEPPPSASPVASPVVDQTVASPAAGTSSEPPFEAIGGTAPMSPGETNYAVLDLTAGDYVAICFVPDAETGVPHFAMGMIAGFTVS